MSATTSATTARKWPRKFPTFSLLACLAMVAAALALLYPPFSETLDRMEYWTSDWRTTLLADPVGAKHDDIAVVLFNLESLGGSMDLPIPRDKQAKLIEAIDAMQPRVIGLDFFYTAKQSSVKDTGLFLKVARSARSPLVIGAIDRRAREFTPDNFAYQLRYLADIGRPTGYVALRHDAGLVVRRTAPPHENSPYPESFARQVVLSAQETPRGPGASSGSQRIAWSIGPGYDPLPFVAHSAKDFLTAEKGTPEWEKLQRDITGKVVLIGADLPNTDRHFTALSAFTGQQLPGVMVHAHIVAQLLDNRYYFELGGDIKWAFLAAIAVIGLWLGWILRGRRASFINLTVATIVLVAVDAACYYFARTSLPLTLALYVWFIGVVAGQHLRTLVRWARSRAEVAAPAPRSA